jgi:hypothetical protein
MIFRHTDRASSDALFLDRLSFFAGHIGGVTFKSYLTNLAHASRAIGAEYEPEYFCNEIIEHPAVLGILKILAVGAGCKLVALAALSYLTPCSLVIFPASRAPAVEICPARPAIQPAAGDQFWIGDDFFHGKSRLDLINAAKVRRAG